MTTLVIPSAGRGSRMGTQPDGPPKCLLPVGGRPILDALVGEAHAAGLDVLVIARPDDAYLRRWRDRVDGPVALTELAPTHYGAVILAAQAKLVGPPDAGFGVIDSDLVLPPGSLRAFLAHAAVNRAGTSLTVGITADPLDLGPRTIWWQPSSLDRARGDRIWRGSPGADARLTGIYWFRPAALEALRRFVTGGGVRFGAFLGAYPPSDVDAFGFAYAFDVNTPDDLAQVRARLA